MSEFDTLGLAPKLLTALDHAGLTHPTPIQKQAIPLALAQHDVLGLAQTGTGKTLAFGLPLIQHLLEQPGKPAPKTVKALVLAPTRELVNQIAESLRPLTAGSKLRVSTVVGGQSIGKQINFLARGTDILVATPGRLMDLMDRGAVDLSRARHLVLDEADQMLDMGFIHALRKIAPKLGTPRQTMLFSATMAKQLEELAQTYLVAPKRVEVSRPGKAADKITQSVHFLPKAAKVTKLRDLLGADPSALTLVFTRTKHGAEKLMKGLVADGVNADSLHGNKSQGQRDRVLRAFRSGEVTVLVATDVAARGIDIPDVAYVINFDLPDTPQNYVHRIGRTARAGREGEAVTLCAPEEVHLLRQIQRLLTLEIPVASGAAPTKGAKGEGAPHPKRPQRRSRKPKTGEAHPPRRAKRRRPKGQKAA
ncbi:MAG: DEAD/DEAH box helicase [Pseudomonadota bacterium]